MTLANVTLVLLVSTTYMLSIQHSLFKVYQITKTMSLNNVFNDILRFFFQGVHRKHVTSQNTPLS